VSDVVSTGNLEVIMHLFLHVSPVIWLC
jgi:hypothetical protein